MLCLAMQIVKAYSVITSIFSIQQLFYKNKTDHIIGTSIEYQTQFNDHRITFFNDPVYYSCFHSPKDKYQEMTISKNIVTNSYLINDPSLHFGIHTYVNVSNVSIPSIPSTPSFTPSSTPSTPSKPQKRQTSVSPSQSTSNIKPLVVMTMPIQTNNNKIVPISKTVESVSDPHKHNIVQVKPNTTPKLFSITPVVSKPIDTHAKPVATHAKPVATHAKPSSHAKPADTQAKPVATHAKPVSTHTKPVSTHSKPLTTHAKPVSTHAKPVSTHAKPVSTHAKPLTTHAKPADTHANPVSTHSKPVVSHAKPVVNHAKPLSTHANPKKFHLSSFEKCKKDHSDYYKRNWFSKIFHANPCVREKYEIVNVNITNTQKCIVNRELWPSRRFAISDALTTGHHTLLQQCSHVCYTNRYRYIGLVDERSCLCSQKQPSHKIVIHSNLCKKCKYDISKRCGNHKYGFLSVYQIV